MATVLNSIMSAHETEQQRIWNALDDAFPVDDKDVASESEKTLTEELADLECRRIEMALINHNNNKTHASKKLGIGRTLLIHKCKKYGIAV